MKNPESNEAEVLPALVGMKEWRASTPETPILETKGLGLCIGITAYDPETKTGHMAHFAWAALEQGPVEDFLNRYVLRQQTLAV